METTELGAAVWAQLRHLLSPLNKYISSFHVRSAMDRYKVIIRFTNNYGLEVSKYPQGDFFDMTVIRFSGQGAGDYKFAFDIPHIPDLTIAYSDKDILRLCEQVSQLR
ncbi:MAG: hypothetical protein PHU44_19285 [Syntrophales bacterium]|nr:hypothetical protein [Syntrophales bacterium]